MSETPKQNEELAKSITGFLDKYGAKLYDSVRKISKSAYNESRINWRFGYEHYLEKSLNKYFYAKTFLSYNEPLPLYDLYVPLSVSCGETVIEKTSITDLISANKFSIIMATGGSGKTMMMRHLFVDTINKTSHVPIFVELRELNDSELDLFGLIKKKLRDNKFDFGDEYIEKALEAGHFILLLDGFDEIASAKRAITIKQITEITEKFEKNSIIISSRPDISLSYWTLFNVWEIQSLSLKLACELIEKTEADKEIKGKFVKALEEELFEKHESFLSNPLLLSIMLITYKESANIPEKISTFYERAYTVLFEQHDARKAYHREKHSKLDILDFKKVFSAFCFLTYSKQLYNFSEDSMFEYLDKAQKATGLNFGKKDFLHDSIQSVCLLLRDGLDITFSHRSFQEYFAAVFVSQMQNFKLQEQFLKSYIGKSVALSLEERSITLFGEKNNNCMELLFEISPEIIEKKLIVPVLEEIEDFINYRDTLSNEMFNELIKIIFDLECSSKFYKDTRDQHFRKWQIVGVLYFINTYYLKSVLSGFLREKFQYLANSLMTDLRFSNFSVNFLNGNSALNDKNFINNLMKEDTIFSFNYFQQIFELKKQLVTQHQKQEMFLEEELFE